VGQRSQDVQPERRVVGLGHVGVGLQLEELVAVLHQGAGHDDDRHVLGLGVLADVGEDPLAREAGHDDVQDDDVGASGAEALHRLHAVVGLVRVVPRLREDVGQEVGAEAIVVHDQHSLHGTSFPRPGRRDH